MGWTVANLVVPYETRITGAAMVYMGFVLCGGDLYSVVASFNFPRSMKLIYLCDLETQAKPHKTQV